jgi:hypothetical protein
MLRNLNLKPAHPQKQLELLHLICAWARSPIHPIACRSGFLQTRSATTSRTLHSRQVELTEDYEQSKLPRYIRRGPYPPPASVPTPEHILSRKQTKHSPSSNPSSGETVYRSRHFNPSREEKPRSQIRLLEPHVLSARLKKLCDGGRIDTAVSTLKNAPLDAQNTPVWNTLIWECMKAKRFKLAYQLFIDVRAFITATWNLLGEN